MGSEQGSRKHSILHPFHHEKHTTKSDEALVYPTTGNDNDDKVELILPLTGAGEEHLFVANDHPAQDPSNADGSWDFHPKYRKTSVAAADTGDEAKGGSDVEKAEFAMLMRETQGMSPEEVKAHLKKRGAVDGGKIIFPKGQGAQQMTGADGGAF